MEQLASFIGPNPHIFLNRKGYRVNLELAMGSVLGFHYKAYTRSIKEKCFIIMSTISDRADKMLI